MITQAAENVPYALADYATTASAIVCKHLALMNVRFTLGLSTPPLQSQTTLPPSLPFNAPDLFSYNFPIKIGDAERPIDGILGYFEAKTDWSRLYPYFPATTSNGAVQVGDPRVRIEPDIFQTLRTFIVEPDAQPGNNSYAASLAWQFSIKAIFWIHTHLFMFTVEF